MKEKAIKVRFLVKLQDIEGNKQWYTFNENHNTFQKAYTFISEQDAKNYASILSERLNCEVQYETIEET